MRLWGGSFSALPAHAPAFPAVIDGHFLHSH